MIKRVQLYISCNMIFISVKTRFLLFLAQLCNILPRSIASAIIFLGIAGDFFRLPAFNYIPVAVEFVFSHNEIELSYNEIFLFAN